LILFTEQKVLKLLVLLDYLAY